MRSSPGPKTGCSSLSPAHRRPQPARVAILTRSEDRVQQAADLATERLIAVAILTRSEDRVQPMPGYRSGATLRLRSSPGPKTGCSPRCPTWSLARLSSCDPHPVRRPGAASAAGRWRFRWRRCDPHPVRRPGAAGLVQWDHAAAEVAILTRSEDRVQREPVDGQPVAAWLRSSPGPKTGCSERQVIVGHLALAVAILTRSEDRVQRGSSSGS